MKAKMEGLRMTGQIDAVGAWNASRVWLAQ